VKFYRSIEAMLEMKFDTNKTRRREEPQGNRTPEATASYG